MDNVAFKCKVCGKVWTKEEVLQMVEGKKGIAREMTIATLWRDHLLQHAPPTKVHWIFLGGTTRIGKYLQVDWQWLRQI